MPLQLLSEDTIFEVKDSDLVGVSDPCEDVSYKVRQLPQPVAREIAKKHTKSRPNPQTHRMEERQDADGILDDAIDYILVDWAGVVMADGATAECSRTNKLSGLDATRKRALGEIAASNRSAGEGRAESFRGTD